MTIAQFRHMLAGGGGTPPYYNIFHVELPDAPTDLDAQKVTQCFEDFYTALHLIYPDTVGIYPSERVVTIEATPRILSAAGAAIAGTATEATGPQLAALISWRTPYAGPRYRGRTYLGPLGANVIDGDSGQIIGGLQANILDAGTDLIADIAALGDGYALGVYSAVAGFQALTPITSCAAQFRVATQRRRN